jgi:hypothetical protein
MRVLHGFLGEEGPPRFQGCGALGVRRSGRCAARDAGARGTRPEPLLAGWLRAVMVQVGS